MKRIFNEGRYSIRPKKKAGVRSLFTSSDGTFSVLLVTVWHCSLHRLLSFLLLLHSLLSFGLQLWETRPKVETFLSLRAVSKPIIILNKSQSKKVFFYQKCVRVLSRMMCYSWNDNFLFTVNFASNQPNPKHVR